jgi:hypothetical protein
VITFETSIRIDRPIDEVFAYVSDPLRFPRWNSAVQAVHEAPGQGREVGSIFTMERELPTGRVENELEVFARDHPSEFGIRTTSGPTPFVYRYRFARPEHASTEVHLDAEVELEGASSLLGPLAARVVKRGVDANFAALKSILERPGGDSRSGGSFATTLGDTWR